MKPHLKYLIYLIRHKWFVFLAGISTKAPMWRLIIHDWSKFLPCEWGAYVRRFFMGKPDYTDHFQFAWLHHVHANPHHWEHWVTYNDKGGKALQIPEHFVREMVADWMGAGRAITGKWDVAGWYATNKERILLHPDTRKQVEELIARYS